MPPRFQQNRDTVILLIGGGEWTRTTDLRIMSGSHIADNKEDQQLSPAECGKIRQNPQAPRNLENCPLDSGGAPGGKDTGGTFQISAERNSNSPMEGK